MEAGTLTSKGAGPSTCRNGHDVSKVGFTLKVDAKGNTFRRCKECQRAASERQTRKKGSLPLGESRLMCRRGLHRLDGSNVKTDPRTGYRKCRECDTAKSKARWQRTRSDPLAAARKKESDRASYVKHAQERKAAGKERYQNIKADPDQAERRRAQQRDYRQTVLKPSGKEKRYGKRYRARLKADTSEKAEAVRERGRARTRAASRRFAAAGRIALARLRKAGLGRLAGLTRLGRQRMLQTLGRLEVKHGRVTEEHVDPFFFTDEGRQRILERDQHRCQECGRELTLRTLDLDHILPIARGGLHFEKNLRALCRPCNARKGAR